VNWSDYQLSGTAAQAVAKKRQTRIGRVIEETTSTLMPLIGLGVAGIIATTYILRTHH
jgi:hypothetical protein